MPRLLVLGSSNTDITVRLPRLPAPGQTVLGGSLLNGPGGKGANQAVAAARAGGDVVFVTALGDDAFGASALTLYRHEGIDISHTRMIPGEGSGVALIFVGDDGENMIGVAPGANARLSPVDVERLPDSLFDPLGVLLIAGLEVPLDTVSLAVRRASGAGMRVVLNPAPAAVGLVEMGILKSLEVVTPNRDELAKITDTKISGEASVEAAARRLLERGPRAVVVTLGAQGCLVLDRHERHRLAPHPVQAVDTVGAGDAFSGALAVALAEGRALADAAAWANAAAALAVTKPGAQAALPSRPDIDRLANGFLYERRMSHR